MVTLPSEAADDYSLIREVGRARAQLGPPASPRDSIKDCPYYPGFSRLGRPVAFPIVPLPVPCFAFQDVRH